MNVWLVTLGEPLPIDVGGDRLLRTGLLAAQLVQAGHHVVWWTSSFDHIRKRHRVAKDAWRQANPQLRIRLLRSCGYRSNISLQRLFDHRNLAAKFARQAPTQPPPDVILCSLPTLELCAATVQFARHRNRPVVVDIRDLWPDVFLDPLPQVMRPVARCALQPLWRLAQNSCAGATAIVGVTDSFVQWGLRQARRSHSEHDQTFPMAYSQLQPPLAEMQAAAAYWKSLGVQGYPSEFVACFFGSLNRHFEIPTVIAAARRLASQGRRVKFVLCGEGSRLDRWRRLAADCPEVLFPGWVNAAKILTLMQLSCVGMTPYASSSNFVANLPNKPIEYLSAGLPILSSLRGTLAGLLDQHDCGLTYANHDAEGLVAAMTQLVDHPHARRRMAQNAQRLYRERFVAETVYRDMAAYLINLTSSGRAAAA